MSIILQRTQSIERTLSAERKSSIERALVGFILGRFGRDYMLIARSDGKSGALFARLLRECYSMRKNGIIRLDVRQAIWKLPTQCICLMCNIIGSNLIVLMCGDVVDLMDRDNSNGAREFAHLMHGFTTRIKKSICINPITRANCIHMTLSNIGGDIIDNDDNNQYMGPCAIPIGTYAIESIIAIMAGIRRVGLDAFNNFVREYDAECMLHIAQMACMRVWNCDYIVTQDNACATIDSRVVN